MKTQEPEILNRMIELHRLALRFIPVNLDGHEKGERATPGTGPREGQKIKDRLWATLMQKYGLNRDPETLMESIETIQAVIADRTAILQLSSSTTNGQPQDEELAERLMVMATQLQCKFTHTNELCELAEADRTLRRALQVLPQDHPEEKRAKIWLALSRVSMTQYNFTKGQSGCAPDADVDRLGEEGDQKISGINGDEAPGMAREDFQDMAVLDRAIQAAKEAVELGKAVDSATNRTRSYLISLLQLKFRTTGRQDSLQEAISMSRQVVWETALLKDPDNDLAKYQWTLGTLLHHSWKAGNPWSDPMAIRDGIDAFTTSLELAPPDAEWRMDCMYQQTQLMQAAYRYPRDRNTQEIPHYEIDGAIDMAERLLREWPLEDPKNERPFLLRDLAIMYHERYSYAVSYKPSDLEVLDRAITVTQQAIEANNSRNDTCAETLISNQATLLEYKFLRTEEIHVLATSIELSQQALDCLQLDHPDRSQLLNVLASRLALREQNISDSSNYPLNISFIDDSAGDVSPVTQVYVESWKCQSSRLEDRLMAANTALELYGKQEKYSAAFELVTEVLGTIILIEYAPMLNHSDKLYLSALRRQLATEAACLLMLLQQSGLQVIHWLENDPLPGRAWSPRMPALSEISEENHHYIVHYHNLISVCRVGEVGCSESLVRQCFCCQESTAGHEVDFISNNDIIDENVEQEKNNAPSILKTPLTQQMLANYKEFQNFLHQIRTLPGFDTFQRPPGLTEQQLAAVNHPGPVVFVNNTRFGTHALILRGTRTETLYLKSLESDTVDEWYLWFNRTQKSRTLARSNHDEQDHNDCILTETDNEKFREMEQWLWKGIVRPVLNELGFIPSKGKPQTNNSSPIFPRIWWIGVGKLNNFPFHVAGDYMKRKSKNRAMQYCVSSYAATLQSLLHSSEQDMPAAATRIALVNTPAVTPSVQVAENVEGISIQAISDPDLVCKAIPDVDIVHITAEVTKVTDSYGASRFQLRGEDIESMSREGSIQMLGPNEAIGISLVRHLVPAEDLNLGVLTFDDFASALIRYYDHPIIVFLESACSDEGATGMYVSDRKHFFRKEFATATPNVPHMLMIVGVPQIVGVRWCINDGVSSDIGCEFYRILCGGGSELERNEGYMSGKDLVAYAIHTAVMRALERYRNLWEEPWSWGAFCHYGG